MKILLKEFRKRGFNFKQLKRTNKAAMYLQSFNGRDVGIEVFRIIVSNDYELGGVKIEGGEMYPGDNAFGWSAWSIPIIDDFGSSMLRAEDKFKSLNDENV